MTELFLIRHAESQPDPAIPESLWRLSSKGRDQAFKLSEFLFSLEPDHLYSSPYPRAVDTIRPLADRLNLEINLDFDLRERKLTEEHRKDWLELLKRAWADFDFALEKCESSRQAQKRVLGSVLKIANKHPGKRIILASHGNAIGLLLNHAKSEFGFTHWQKLRNPDVHKLTLTDETLEWHENFTYT